MSCCGWGEGPGRLGERGSFPRRWMDAVELPLPAKVDFGKILTPAAVEGLEGGGGGGGGGGGDVLRRCADADRRHGGIISSLMLMFCLLFAMWWWTGC